MLKISNLTKSFKQSDTTLLVLDNINLEISKGEIFGVIGLSGEGKSTFVRCLNLLERPDSGEIIYDDEGEIINVLTLKGKKLQQYRQKVSMIFQDFNLLNQKNVYENIEFPLTLQKGYKKGSSDEKIQNLIKLVGLDGKQKSYPSMLSGGQKQRVAIARSLIMDPSILLCDECTSALDPTTSNQILDLLKELNKTLGLTIIIIAHQMSVIERICTKVAILSDHKIVECGSVSDVFLNPKTEAAKSLIYSGHVVTKLHETKMIMVTFNGDTEKPIVAGIVQECNILVSIVYANQWMIDNKIFGKIIFRLPYYEDDIIKLKKYLEAKEVTYEEVSSSELGKHININ